jgi:hypothetical protein
MASAIELQKTAEGDVMIGDVTFGSSISGGH